MTVCFASHVLTNEPAKSEKIKKVIINFLIVFIAISFKLNNSRFPGREAVKNNMKRILT